MTQLLAIAHVIKIILIGICIITAYYWIKAFIAAKRCDSVINRFGKRFGDEFLKTIENARILYEDIDHDTMFRYTREGMLNIYKRRGCEKPDHVWTVDDMSHLFGESFDFRAILNVDKDTGKDNERGRQIKVIQDNLNNLQNIVNECDKYCSDKNAQFYFVPKVIYDDRELERINYKKYLTGAGYMYIKDIEEKKKKLDEWNNQKKKRK